MNKKFSMSFSIAIIVLISILIYRSYKSSEVINDIKVVFSGNGEYECNASIPSLGPEVLEKVYIKDKIMKIISDVSIVDFNSKVKPISFISYIIARGNYSYTGSDKHKEIYRKKILEKDTFEFFNKSRGFWGSRLIEDFKYSCKKTKIPDSLFELPPDGKFIDY